MLKILIWDFVKCPLYTGSPLTFNFCRRTETANFADRRLGPHPVESSFVFRPLVVFKVYIDMESFYKILLKVKVEKMILVKF